MSTRKTVQMTVTATVEFPDDAPDTSDEMAMQLAMSAVTQFHEVDCGEHSHVIWARIFADVTDNECEVMEGGDA